MPGAVRDNGSTTPFVSVMFEFSWRYQLPGLVLWLLAVVLAVTVLIGGSRRRRTRRRMLAPFPDSVDQRAMTAFTERYGRPRFASVLVVIAAYNEEDGIGGVLDKLPATCLDLPVDVLVVVDGAADDTASVAMAHGAYTCVAPVNRGQGAALRLGYQLAAHGGARYVITTDADGQYDNSEMPLLLGPLVADTHDFVTGSRRLGALARRPRLRHPGQPADLADDHRHVVRVPWHAHRPGLRGAAAPAAVPGVRAAAGRAGPGRAVHG